MNLRERVIHFLQEEVDKQHIPGAVISVSYQNEILVQEAVGYRVVHPSLEPMKLDTVFDIASLTKVVATLPAILLLLERGKLHLEERVGSFLPDFNQFEKSAVTIKHLLTHTSGLPSHRQYYRQALQVDEIIQSICMEKLEFLPGTKVTYSDLGFILLSKLVEIITEERFDAFIKREIFDPLEMKETQFNPSFVKNRYAATEFSKKLQVYKQGIVHDENAEVMGGISGHAGLFSTLSDLTHFASMVERKGLYQGNRTLSEAAINLSLRNYTNHSQEQRGLAWLLKSSGMSPCGDLFSDRSYGHTGFTGTSIWFDPEINLHVIFLTNRVHFGRNDHILRVRPRLHNVIKAAI